MDIFVFKGVKTHEIRHVREVLDSARDREPRMIDSGEEDATVVDEVGQRNADFGLRMLPAGDCRAAPPAPVFSARRGCGGGETRKSVAPENPRPVTVNVNVTANGGGGGKAGNGLPNDGAERVGKSAAALAAIRKKTDLIPGLVEKVDATPGRTAALVKTANREVRRGSRCDVPSGRLRAKRADAGRRRAVVYDIRDRKAIRVEVKRVMGFGVSQTEACRQVAEQAEKGRAGAHALTMKYNLPAATGAIVRRVFLSKR